MTADNRSCWEHWVSPRKALTTYPLDVQPLLEEVLRSRGVIDEPVVADLMARLGVDIGGLMVELLRLARAYAIVPISEYAVGAVARGMPSEKGPGRLYLGANMEICGQSPSFTVHGEQAATINAWHHGEPGLRALATSSAPCGYCRQFLYEISTAETLDILVPDGVGSGPDPTPLPELLPDAFGPGDIHNDGERLMQPQSHPLALADGPATDLEEAALAAAVASYAPYTGGFAGAAVELEDGTIWAGRYAENAAHNPTVRPLVAAATFLNLNRPVAEPTRITKAVLVERHSVAGERGAAIAVLQALAPGVQLDYRAAEVF